ncbi:unnamed protein product [Blepharisma stoltei]|uniref:Uncharacterized protein n=1 Tax=Blepharisma stoltei TaxID=1481888 RepID=A0AAU9JGW9_9CILI|nr:unnamed protein product [Blepharisma stoltei]
MLAILVSLFTSALAGPEFLQAGVSATYNIFTIEWKPTMCMTTKCQSGYYGLNFNIHGLWPSVASGTQPQYCTSSYSFSVNSTTQAAIQQCWLSDSETPLSFWEHEWEKHGVCMNPAVPSNTYFADAAQLFNQLGVLNLLAAKGIKPSNSQTVSKNTFYGAFSNAINIQCFESSGKYYIENVLLCYDNSLKQIDCTKASTNCGDSFYFPSSTSAHEQL